MNKYINFISIYQCSVLLFVFSLLINNLVSNQIKKTIYFSLIKKGRAKWNNPLARQPDT